MRGLFFAALLVSHALYSADAPSLVTTSFVPDALPSSFVNSVHVMSGSLYFSGVDVSVPGQTALHAGHYYSSDTVFPTWFGKSSLAFGFPTEFVIEPIARSKNMVGGVDISSILVDEGTGTIAQYVSEKEKKGITYRLCPNAMEKGYTNTGGGAISARTNLKNTYYYCSKIYPGDENIPENADDITKILQNCICI